VLARVVTKLGSLPDINTKVIEGLFASDLNYLQELYERLNGEAAEGEMEAASGSAAAALNGGRHPRGFGILGEA
jgi:hypothetical protein